MVYDEARKLAEQLKASEEYRTYREAKERAYANESTRTLLTEYHKLQMKAQANAITGEQNEEVLAKLQKLGELLQFDADAAAYLFAEYRVKTMLGDVYKILAEAVGIDLSMLEG